MKRILGMFMSFAMIISLASFNMKDVSASELSLIDFDFDIYKANLSFKEGNNPVNNGVPPYLDVVKNYHDINHPSGILINDLDKDAQFAVKIKAFSALTFEPSETLSKALEESEYDFAILLAMLNISTTNDDIIKAMNSKYEKAAKTSEGYISRYLKSVYGMNVTSSTSLSSIDKTKMEDAVTNLMKNKYNMVDGIDKGVKLADQYYASLKDVESIINKITQYICIYMMEEETFSVLEHMYRKTSDSNLKYALNKIITCKDNILATVDNALKDCNEVVFKAIFKKVVGDMWSKIIKGSPAEVLYIAQKTAKQLCNVCFSTDQISEQYYKMKELCEIENLLVTASADIGNEYLSNKTSFNAKAYNNSVDLYFNLCGVSADYAIEFANIIYNKSSAAIFLDKNNYDDFVKTVNSIKTTYETIKEDLNTNYLIYLEEDYPTIYKEYNNMVLEGENGGINTSGKCGENVEWTLYNNGHLYISGTGKMNNYANYPSWSSSASNIKDVTIEQGVTNIGKNAFSECTSLTSITIPNSVTSIEYDAFDRCTSLTSITIPNSVTRIGIDAFFGCTSLTSITIPNSVTSIGGYAFYGCTSLKSITIPDSVTSIGSCEFFACTSLTNITIPDSVTSIGSDAFSGCTSLKSITIPNSVTSIGNQAFFVCTSLTSITIPNSVTSIGECAFTGCTNLTLSVYKGSYGEKYAKENNLKYKVIEQEVKPTSIKLNATSKIIQKGKTYTLITTITPSNATDKTVTYTTSNSKVATVDENGLVKAVGYGNAIITATTANGKEATCKVNVYAAIDDCNVSKIQSQTYTGKALQPVVTVKDGDKILSEGIDYTVTYEDNVNVGTASVTITGKGNYTGTITKTFKINPKKVNPTSIKLNATSKTIQKGKTYTLTTTVTPTNATDKTVTYTTSNSKVATVTKNGTIKAINYGTAVIAAKTKNGKTATCKVTVPYTVKYNLNGGTNNKSNPISYYGKKITLQNPTRKGYVFAGWYSDSKFKTKITSFSSGNKVVYAKWNKVNVSKAKTPTLTNIGTRKLKVSYTATSGVKGYQIQYATNSKFTGSKTKYVTSRSYTLTSLIKGKRYYVRVRGYKLDSTGNKVYGSWSRAKNIKISK